MKEGCIDRNCVGMAEGNTVGGMTVGVMYVIFPWNEYCPKLGLLKGSEFRNTLEGALISIFFIGYKGSRKCPTIHAYIRFRVFCICGVE